VSDGGRVRLFVALELPGGVRMALAGWRDAVLVPEMRPVPVESLHVTLCFLGSLPAAAAPDIGEACAAALAGGGPPRVEVGAATWLPQRRPQVLAVGLDDPDGELARRQAALAAGLAAGGWFEPETRRFFAHVTVARVRRGERVRPAELTPPPAVEFEGTAVTLLRSHSGAAYESLRTISLGDEL
jgi:2'-5' RNA ligase